MLQNYFILELLTYLFFTMVEENLKFHLLKCSRIFYFRAVDLFTFHHGWRKFWNLISWNAPELLYFIIVEACMLNKSSNAFLKNSADKILDFGIDGREHLWCYCTRVSQKCTRRGVDQLVLHADFSMCTRILE